MGIPTFHIGFDVKVLQVVVWLLSLKIYKMPRNYVRKTVKSYTKENLANCIDAVKTEKMSLRKASKHFQVRLCYIFLVF